MNTIDLIVCLVLALAVWNGWRKGFIVQVCSLVAIAAGLWCAAHYGPGVGDALHLDPSVRTAGGFAVVLRAAKAMTSMAASNTTAKPPAVRTEGSRCSASPTPGP